MAALDQIAGKPVQMMRRLVSSAPTQFTVNATVKRHVVAIPPGAGRHRIVDATVACSDVPSDPDGTMLVHVKVADASEGGVDTVVASGDLETLVVAADRGYALTFAADTSEKERTVEGGDVIYIELVNNSAAITTNPFAMVTIGLVPLDQPDSASVLRAGSY